jgi:raffinose/stachyose/melibiose transport system permease protein
MSEKKKHSSLNSVYSMVFAIPSSLIYLVFFLIPTGVSFYFAFTDWNAYIDGARFIGLGNFKLIFNDRIVVTAIKNTLIFSICTTIGKNVFGLILALILNLNLKTRVFLRSVFYAPSIMSNIVIGLLFTAILHPTGMLNNLLSFLGLGGLAHDWLVEKDTIMYTVSAVEIWQWSGFHMLIFLAGLQSIPNDYIEAARIDGASRRQSLIRIILPLLIPSFSVNVVMSLIGGLKVFGQVYILTNGGPGYASQVISTYVFRAFGYGQWGVGNAANLLLFVVITIIAYTVLSWLRKREVEY